MPARTNNISRIGLGVENNATTKPVRIIRITKAAGINSNLSAQLLFCHRYLRKFIVSSVVGAFRAADEFVSPSFVALVGLTLRYVLTSN